MTDLTHKPGTSPDAPAGASGEVRAKRRTFSAQDKARILREAERCPPGELGALLRREGIYSAHLSKWRQQRDRGQLAGLTPRKRGPKVDPQAERLAKLERENARLQSKLGKAELITLAPRLRAAQVQVLTPKKSFCTSSGCRSRKCPS